MAAERVDTLISGAKIVTMDSERRVYMDGSLAIKDNKIAAIGPRANIDNTVESETKIDGSRFVLSPGFVNGHIHITGDPLTKGYLPDDLDGDFAEKLTRWVLPRYYAHSPEDERLSAQLASLSMLRCGITSFIEAGTVRHLDNVFEGVASSGIRARVGTWIEGRSFDPDVDQSKATSDAINKMEQEVNDFPDRDDARVVAWPILVGHNMNSDGVWKAAKSLADEHGLGISAHMSPYQTDPDWYLAEFGHRPIEHLASLGALGENVSLTHVAYIDKHEQDLLAETKTNVVNCSLASLKGAFGLTSVGRFPEMAAAGINIVLGSDGYDCDMLRLAQLMSAFFKDARHDIKVFPAHEVLTMITRNGAQALGLQDEIGSLEAGKKADFVAHDTDRPEWHPLTNVVNQLVWFADGRGVHSVWVDGVRVVDNYHATQLDEEELYAKAQIAAEGIIKRADLPAISPWPVI